MGEAPVHNPCAQSTTPTAKQKSAHLTGAEHDSAENAEISAAFAAADARMVLSTAILSMPWRPLP